MAAGNVILIPILSPGSSAVGGGNGGDAKTHGGNSRGGHGGDGGDGGDVASARD